MFCAILSLPFIVLAAPVDTVTVEGSPQTGLSAETLAHELQLRLPAFEVQAGSASAQAYAVRLSSLGDARDRVRVVLDDPRGHGIATRDFAIDVDARKTTREIAVVVASAILLDRQGLETTLERMAERRREHARLGVFAATGASSGDGVVDYGGGAQVALPIGSHLGVALDFNGRFTRSSRPDDVKVDLHRFVLRLGPYWRTSTAAGEVRILLAPTLAWFAAGAVAPGFAEENHTSLHWGVSAEVALGWRVAGPILLSVGLRGEATAKHPLYRWQGRDELDAGTVWMGGVVGVSYVVEPGADR